MNNKTIIEFRFRMKWRIMQFSEDVITTPSASLENILLSLNCTILHILLILIQKFLHGNI